MRKILPIVFLLLIATTTLSLAAPDFNQPLTPEEEAQFDAILSPVMKIYNFIKYAATIIGVIMLAFAGVSFLIAGGESKKKDNAKNMAVGVVIGLIVIWIAPLVVQYIFS